MVDRSVHGFTFSSADFQIVWMEAHIVMVTDREQGWQGGAVQVQDKSIDETKCASDGESDGINSLAPLYN